MAWKNIPEKKVLATLKDGKDFKGAAAEKMTIYVDGEIPGSEGDVKGVSVTVDPSTYVMTTQLKDGKGGNVGSPATVDLPLESMVVGGEYDDATKKVILTLKNGETVEFSVADLVAGLQSEITPQNPLSADLVAESVNKEFVTHSEKTALEQLDAAGVNDIARILQSENETVLNTENGDEIHFIMESQGAEDPTGLTIVTPTGQVNLEQGVSGDINPHTFGDEYDAENMRAGTYSYNPVSGTDLYIDSAHTVQVTEAGTLIVGEPSNDEQTVLFIPADGSGIKTYHLDLNSGEVGEKSVGSGNVGRYLTSDDYNWNSRTKTATEPYNAVALWLMEPGIYLNTPNNTRLSVFTTRDNSETSGGTFFVMNRGTNGTENELATILYVDGLNTSIRAVNVQKNNGAAYFGTRTLITSEDVVNNLSSTSGTTPLSANQGRVLDEKIGDLNSLETTDKSSLVGAINEVAEGGSGGGGVLTLYMLDIFNTYTPAVGDHLEFCRDKELTDPITATELDAALNEGKVVQINCLYNAGDDWAPNYVMITDFYDDGSYGSYMFFTLRSRNSDAGYRVNFLGDNDYATVIEKETYDVQADWNEASDNSSAFIKNKPTIPSKVSDLTNDSGYQNASQVSSAIASAVGDITSFEYQVVQALPQSGEKGVIYLVANSGTTPNIYDEYIWVNNTFEKIGTTEMDLSNYPTKSEMNTALAGKVDAVDPSDLPSGAYQGSVVVTDDKENIDPSSVEEGQIVVDPTTKIVYVISKETEPGSSTETLVFTEVGKEQVVFLPMTITNLQALTFSMENTVAEINAMINAGMSVFYRLVLPQDVGSLRAGTYDFRPFYSSNVAIMSSMIGASSSNTILGIAWHTATGTPYLEMRTLANTQMVTNAINDALVDYYSKGETNNLLDGKADAPSAGETYVTSSELQTISDELANKVDSSDLSAVATSGAYSDLTGVPSNIVTDASYVHTDNNFTTAEKNKLSNIPSGAEANVQSNWTQTDTTKDDYVKNVPTAIRRVYGDGTMTSPWAVLSGTISGGTYDGDEVANYIRISGGSLSTVHEVYAGAYTNDIDTVAQKEARLALYSDLPVITMTTTDPGEGATLEANHFIAVYEA